MDLKKALKRIRFYEAGTERPTSFKVGDVLQFERTTARFAILRDGQTLDCETQGKRHPYFTIEDLGVPEMVAADLAEISKLTVRKRMPPCKKKPVWDFEDQH